MKYYSEVTKLFYQTEKEALMAEQQVRLEQEKEAAAAKARAETQAKRQQEIEEAYEKYQAAKQAYLELAKKFSEDYGMCHVKLNPGTWFTDLLDLFGDHEPDEM